MTAGHFHSAFDTQGSFPPPYTGEKGALWAKMQEKRREAAITSTVPVSCGVTPLFTERAFSIYFLLFFCEWFYSCELNRSWKCIVREMMDWGLRGIESGRIV
ncbi:hypothetical protein CDAR_418661 [Caerostris darwini]|uniref:Uncharacterized protein n=1 Tax=Caerostris darwini TaxID=1538125 RepID=A0AAV4MV35_9ARAC|nr:hypothetical protein CDAR_418661 [Caerostris darwini]